MRFHVGRTFGEPLGHLLKTHPDYAYWYVLLGYNGVKACWDSFIFIDRENKKETDAHGWLSLLAGAQMMEDVLSNPLIQ